MSRSKTKDTPANVFRRALKEAQASFDLMQKERDACRIKLTKLDKELPALEHTILALRNQLDPKAQALPERKPPVSVDLLDQEHGLREVEPGMGSIPPALPIAPVDAMDIESLPNMDGDWT